MTRTEKILGGINLDTAVGLEVGALDNPIVPPDTPGIFYVDHVDTPTLREKYKEHPNVHLDKLVEVNGVWGEKTLAEAAASVAPVDFFVASHVIEHVPNLIGWLQEIDSVLKPGGHVGLAVPDRRFTFDYLRRETGLAEVLTAHLAKARTPMVQQIIDHFENVTKVDAGKAWAGTLDRSSLEKHHTAAEMMKVVEDALHNGSYHDVHCWVFTPLSFAQLMGRLADLEYHCFACHRFHDSELNTYEFFVSMERVPDAKGAAASWRALAAQIEQGESEKAAKSAEAAAARAREPVERKLAQSAEHVGHLQHQIELLQHELKSQKYEIEVRQAEIDHLHNSMSALQASTSWRVTAPLRAFRRIFQ